MLDLPGPEALLILLGILLIGLIGYGLYEFGCFVYDPKPYRASWLMKDIKKSKEYENLIKNNDPWGRPLSIKESKGFLERYLNITCLGEDGIEGTKDDITVVRKIIQH